MLNALSGEIVEITPGQIILAVSGVEYEVQVSLVTYERLSGAKSVRLLVRAIYGEDHQSLYGFLSRDERALFDHLREVSGVGAKLALKMLSTLPPADLAGAISEGDVTSLMRVKGLGRKKAEMVVATLRNSVDRKLAASGARGAPLPALGARGDAILALLRLGYRRPEAEQAIAEILSERPDLPLEATLREALKRLS